MKEKTAIVWFRLDLRLKDNPALIHALDEGYSILPVYILDDENADEWKMGAASKWWLCKSLQSLNQSLDGHMVFRKGNANDIIPELIKDSGATAVFWNRCYEPWRINRDKGIKEDLQRQDIEVESFNGSLLWEPWEIEKESGGPYKVFTPFYKKGCLKKREPDEPIDAPSSIHYADFHDRYDVSHLDLLPENEWYKKFEQYWTPGEQGASDQLGHFLENGLNGYKEGRNNPSQDKVSRLSPYLHRGEISPREVWHTSRQTGFAEGWEKDTEHFCSELGWREFSYNLMYNFPKILREPLQEKFERFAWDDPTDEELSLWHKGRTGIPIVDAGMRELWETGWMHNRVRMIVASLLVKNMLIHWHYGEDWFWDCLVDADLANNSASWQWVAGSGADAAPYFRIFNPVSQGARFDKEGVYVRQYVPELKDMPDKYIHNPWDAPQDVLDRAGVILGKTYPKPIVDLKKSREKALEAFADLKKNA